MTTIATDGISMAGDGRTQCSGSIISEDMKKVFRLNDGRIVGSCGEVADILAFCAWLDNKIEKPTVSDDFGAIVISSLKPPEWYSGKLIPSACMMPAAMGSGFDLAIGAMEAGATPEQAVQIACKRDVNSGGQITVMRLINGA